jgi:hypothetical protein
MAGDVVTVVAPRRYDFSTLTNGKSMVFRLSQRVDARNWVGAALLMRLTELDMGGGNVVIQAQRDGWTTDDPGNDFLTNIPGAAFTLGAEPFTPIFEVIDLGVCLGSYLAFTATASRTSATNNILATLSLEVRFRNNA